MNSLGAIRGVYTECARRGRGETRRTAVTDKIPLAEELHERVFTMARDRARVAYSSCIVGFILVIRGRVARQAGEERLSQGAQGLRARVKRLRRPISTLLMNRSSGTSGKHTYGKASRASASNRSWDSIKLLFTINIWFVLEMRGAVWGLLLRRLRVL